MQPAAATGLMLTKPGVPAWEPDGGLPLGIQTSTAVLSARLYGHRGDPVVILPDGPGFASSYLAPVASMLSLRYQALLVDQRGSGTSLTLDQSFKVWDYIADLEDVRHHLDTQRLHLVGHGWGGLLAQLYAAALPERVAGLFLIGPAPGVGLAWTWARRHEARTVASRAGFLGSARTRLWSALVHLHEELGGDQAAQRLCGLTWTAWFADPRGAPPPEESWRRGARSRAMVATDRSLRETSAGMLPSVVPAPCPVLVLYGEYDLYGRAAQQTVRDRFAGARQVQVVGAGHVPWLEKPGAFESELARFFELGARRRSRARPHAALTTNAPADEESRPAAAETRRAA